MHILLTDILTCPRCGPGFGLILLADRMEQRRVLQGRLGCSNCREQYAIRNGAGLFGGTLPVVAAAPAVHGADDAEQEQAVRVAALLGLGQGSGFVLLAGPAVAAAPALSELLEGVEVVVAGDGAQPTNGGYADDRDERDVAHDAPGGAGGFGVSRLATGSSLPLANGKLLGAALTGAAADTLLEEAARAVSPVGRLLLDPAPVDAEGRLQPLGWKVALREGDVVLATRTH